MEDPILICVGSHGGKHNYCESCKFNMENQPDFKGLRNEPEGKYQFLNDDICRLPVGPERKYWTLYRPIKHDS